MGDNAVIFTSSDQQIRQMLLSSRALVLAAGRSLLKPIFGVTGWMLVPPQRWSFPLPANSFYFIIETAETKQPLSHWGTDH